MARLLAATTVLLAALVCTTGARLPMAGMAPAPSMEGGKMPKADLTFILSADTASFTPEGTLVLTNPAQTTAFTAKKGQSGIYPTSYFTNVQPGSKFLSADGKWLDMPQAALYGASAQGNNQSVVLLTLGSPTYNAANKTLTFPYQFLTPMESSLKYHGGAVGHVVKDAQSGNGMSNVIGQILPGMSMNGAALFIDSNSMALQPTAETKTWWFPWWGGWGNNYYGNGYDNGYYNNGYNGGYYNNGGGYYNNNNNNNNNGWGGNNNNNNNNNGRH